MAPVVLSSASLSTLVVVCFLPAHSVPQTIPSTAADDYTDPLPVSSECAVQPHFTSEWQTDSSELTVSVEWGYGNVS